MGLTAGTKLGVYEVVDRHDHDGNTDRVYRMQLTFKYAF